MMLADRVQGYVLDDYHLVVSLRRYDVQELTGIVVQTGADLFVHQRDSARCLLDARPARVFANALENQPHSGFDLGMIERVASILRLHFVFLWVGHPVGLSYSREPIFFDMLHSRQLALQLEASLIQLQVARSLRIQDGSVTCERRQALP